MNCRIIFMAAIFCVSGLGNVGGQTNFYSRILQRNVFALKTAPPTVVIPPMPPPASVMKIRLTGIAVVPPRKWAVLKIQNQAGRIFSIVLSEGGTENNIEVIAIDGRTSQATVRNAGVLMCLNLEGDSALFQTGTLASQLADDHKPVPPPDENP